MLGLGFGFGAWEMCGIGWSIKERPRLRSNGYGEKSLEVFGI